MKYWLMKNEPEDFSIDDLEKVGVEHWDGIRNYQVRNFMRDEMSVGDLAFFYHSNCKVPGIVGMMEIVSEAYPDHTAWDPDEHYYDPRSKPESPVWLMVDVRYLRTFSSPVTLKALRACPELADMRILQRGNRLSVTPLSPEHWNFILGLAGEGA
ncbi:MAG: EVE domain-containing protein [Gammaproteobacteria bacterium]|nr:EVE domain-containing protein [Gammaproteobacteria bacterium]MYD75478.1 EVE domain-containing protein [Gammaproteobacteria bacterium]MYJ51643.1 EVE domain-containing protein [Gammaproteobacteria bacterium]